MEGNHYEYNDDDGDPNEKPEEPPRDAVEIARHNDLLRKFVPPPLDEGDPNEEPEEPE